MADFFQALNDRHRALIAGQPVCFLASAARHARIDPGPLGLDGLRILSPGPGAYRDLGGMGNEAHAQLADWRSTPIFCSSTGTPLILLMYRRGRPVLPRARHRAELAAHFTPAAGHAADIRHRRGERADLVRMGSAEGGARAGARHAGEMSSAGRPGGMGRRIHARSRKHRRTADASGRWLHPRRNSRLIAAA